MVINILEEVVAEIGEENVSPGKFTAKRSFECSLLFKELY